MKTVPSCAPQRRGRRRIESAVFWKRIVPSALYILGERWEIPDKRRPLYTLEQRYRGNPAEAKATKNSVAVHPDIPTISPSSTSPKCPAFLACGASSSLSF